MMRLICAFVCALSLGQAAYAMSINPSVDQVSFAGAHNDEKSGMLKGATGTDLTDIWWNENESGWGMQVIQNASTLFATIYAYNGAGQPTFFVGVLTRNGATFSGQLSATTGPYYGGVWNPAAVTETVVGSISITPVTVQSINLSYSVNGVIVSKLGLTRLPLANDNLSGVFSGVANQTQTCSAVLPSGTFNNRGFAFSITHGGTSSLTAQVVTSTSTCNLSGNYTQEGRFGRSWGNFSCNNGEAGTFDFFEIQVYTSGIVTRFTTSSNYCQVTGRLTATLQP